jgi:hypothetical protein
MIEEGAMSYGLKRRTLYDPNDPVWTTARANADIVFCTVSVLETIVKERQSLAFVWPEEGDFNEHDDFVFNADHTPKAMAIPNYEPLLCDIQTAQMLMTLRGAMSDKIITNPKHGYYGKTRLQAFDGRIAESRAYFALFVEKGWSFVSFKAT